MRWLWLAQSVLLWCAVGAEDCPYPCICYENADEERTLTVDCRNQELFEIPLGVPPTTSHLDVSHNSIQFVRAVDLQNLPALTYLQLHTNDIMDIEAGAFQELVSLEALALQNNLLQMLRPGIFAGLSNLQTLNLFNNYLDELDPGVFSPLENLVFLDLAYNSLEMIMSGTFINLPRLFDLNLGENFISDIEREAISNLPFLRTLNIEGNQLQSVTTNAWTNVSFLHSIRLDRNPLECGCQALWLRQWFLDHSLRGPVPCNSPSDLQGMDLLRLTPDDFCRLPTASIMEEDPVVLTEGMTLQLTCVTSGAPPPVSMWSREGMTFDLMDRRLEFKGDSLLINDVIVNDTGQYFCSVMSSAGTTASSIDVVVVATEDVSIPLTIATVGDRVILECGDDLPISVETKWRFFPSPFMNVSSPINFTERFVMGERGELVVFRVQPEDMGRYECVLAENVSLFHDLQLQAVPSISIDPEPNCATPNSLFLQTIDSIALVCEASGVPTPTVTWVTPQSGNITGEGRAVVPLFSPLPEDAGDYMCTAVNDVGMDVRTIRVNVMAVLSSGAPIFGSQQFLVGETAILNCSFPNRTIINFQWIRTDSRPFSLLSVQTSDGTLIIPELTLDDISVYRCQALFDQNQFGFIERGVLVFEPATVTGGYPLPEVREVMDGDDITLNCSIRGNARPTLDWLFGNETIEEGGRFEFRSRVVTLGIQEEELIIRDVHPSDRGLYTCNASNVASMRDFSDHYTYFLEVQEAISMPFFRREPLPVDDVVVGEVARLHCQPENADSLSWFMTPIDVDDPVTEILPSQRIVISPMELVIFDVVPEDEGFYFCTAENEAGMITSSFGQLNVWIPPQIQEALPINYLVVEGTSSILIPCFGTGDPEPVVDWLRDNRVLPFSTKQRILPDGSLEIFTIAPDDAGEYVCRLANAAGQQFRTVNVFVRAIPRARIDPSDPSPVDVGSQLSLFCSDMGTRPEELEMLVWRRDDNPLITTGNVVVFPDTGELVLSDLQLSDSGNYTCEISSYAGESEANVEVIVEDPFLASGARPLSLTTPTTRSQLLGEGQTAQFVCISSLPRPASTIEWFKDGSPLRNLRRITIDDETGGLLTIENTRITDEGQYTCVATNRIGEQTCLSFNLTISTGPIFTWPPQAQQVTVGQNITLRCKAAGSPEPEITWLHNGTELDFENCVTVENQILHICNTTLSSGGWYSCFAQNLAGTAEYTVSVVVTPQPPVPPNIANMIESEIIRFGNSLILDCIATGSPQPSITWFKDGEVLVNSTCPGVFGGECLLLDDKSVYIQNTRVSDSGTYTCVAENSGGVAVYSVSILVEEPSILPMFTVFPRVVNESMVLVEVECQADGQPTPSLSWLTADLETISTNNTDRIYSEGGTLYIRLPSPDDSGQYICRAENSAGVNQVAVILWLAEDGSGGGGNPPRLPNPTEVPEVPKFLVSPEDVVTYVGLPVIVPCTTYKTDDQNSFTVWRRNDLTLYQDGDVTVTTNGSLIIERSKVEDSGTYDCVAINEEGVAMATIAIQVHPRPGPPEFLATPPDLRVTSGSSFMLPCQPHRSTNESVSLLWLLDGESVIDTCGESEVREDGSLLITKATPTSAGIYTCRISNQHATVDAMATVTVTDYPISDTVAVTAGDTFELQCPLALSSDPETDIHWSMGSQPLFPFPSLIPFGYMLLFTELLPSHHGEYTCSLLGQNSSIFLDVLEAPSIVNHTSSLAVFRELPVILQCVATGNPRPQITWSLNGQPVERGVQATPLTDGSLYLHPPLPLGEHLYTCTAGNEVGGAEADTILTVLPGSHQTHQDSINFN